MLYLPRLAVLVSIVQKYQKKPINLGLGFQVHWAHI